MGFKKVTAIIQWEALERVEKALEEEGTPGIGVSPVKGYGDYADFYKSPPLVRHARIEIFTDDFRVASTVKLIIDTAHTGLAGDGVVAVMPAEHLYRIRDKTEMQPAGRG